MPDTFLQTEFFSVLAGFVAINTLVYVSLAVAKMLPKAHPTDWWYQVRHRNRRRESRSIYPEADLGPLLQPPT